MSNDFDKLIEAFLKFPGIGPRQAKRFAYFLVGENSAFAANLSRLIANIKNNTKQCRGCFLFFENDKNETCAICRNINRDNKLLMIVEKDVDLENIEKSNIYNGKYFILGGTLALTKNGEDKLGHRLKKLFEKTKKEKPKEIILATSATIEGENTARYVERILEPLTAAYGGKITRLGRGLSTGTELEYSDSETIANAMKNRK